MASQSRADYDPRPLLGLPPTAPASLAYLEQVARLTDSGQLSAPDIKSYPDALYKNYYALGLSLMFVDKDGSKSIKNIDPQSDKLVLESIDIYNAESDKEKENPKGEAASSPAHNYASYPAPLLVLSLSPSVDAKEPRPQELMLTISSTGKDIVRALGEPDRKGGGAGPSSGSLNVWCEWTADGIMIEFGGSNARGPQAWERGKDAKWRTLTLFRTKAP